MDWPVDCTLGSDCFIEDYVDRDPGSDSQDYTCGLNTRDGHKGTDIALLSFDRIDGPGVAVRAVAPGTVLRMRDGMDDTGRTQRVSSDRACGNAVIVQHENGYRTQYCHLRKGSVVVQPGDRVQGGDTLGVIGLSGLTTHPHLHLSVYLENRLVDPFAPDGAQACGATQETLWLSTPDYHATLLRLAGFSTEIPSYDALRGGTARRDTISPTEPLVVYVEAGYAQDGDVLTISATGPDGEIFRDTRVMESPRVSQLPAFGRRAPAGGWTEGEYHGQITVTRDGEVIANRFAHVMVQAP